MANRHSHKKLRAEIRARMAATGETYQKAHWQILGARAKTPNAGSADLVPITYFGVPATLATFEALGRLFVMLVSSPVRAHPFPANPMLGMLGTRSVQ